MRLRYRLTGRSPRSYAVDLGYTVIGTVVQQSDPSGRDVWHAFSSRTATSSRHPNRRSAGEALREAWETP